MSFYEIYFQFVNHCITFLVSQKISRYENIAEELHVVMSWNGEQKDRNMPLSVISGPKQVGKPGIHVHTWSLTENINMLIVYWHIRENRSLCLSSVFTVT